MNNTKISVAGSQEGLMGFFFWLDGLAEEWKETSAMVEEGE